MNKLFSFVKKHEFLVRISIVLMLFLSLFIPFYIETAAGYGKEEYIIVDQLKIMFKTFREGRIPSWGVLPLSFFIPLFFLILGAFAKYHRIFNSFWNIGCLCFIGFFFIAFSYELAPMLKSVLCENDSLLKINCHFAFSSYIWLLLFIADCIYIVHGLKKAYPKEYKKQSKNERIAELEKQIEELQNTKKDR